MGFNDFIKKIIEGYVINQVKNINIPNFNPSPIVRIRTIFLGRVQKVGFRKEIHELAKRLQLTGWVKNRNDKNVEAEIQGENEKIIFLIKYMKALKRATVHDVVINEMLVIDDDTNFMSI